VEPLRRRAALVAVGLAAAGTVAAIAIAVHGGGRKPSPAPIELGANTGRLFNGGNYDRSQIDAQLAALARAGATVARSDALWEVSEPRPPVAGVHRYDWSFDDAVAAALAAHRLRWLPIIDYAPPWARSHSREAHSPPASAADYARYAAAVAARYGPGGAFWRSHPQLPALPVSTYEIWNEPDNPVFWAPAPDPAAYARLYQSAHAAIAAVHPAATVIVGGLTDPGAFLPRMLSAAPALRGMIGGVAIHPYAPTPGAVLAKVRADRLLLRSLGLGATPLYVTEVGWTTSPPGAPDWAPASARPGYLYQTITALAASGCGLAAVVVYAWFTPAHDPADPQDWFGINPPSAAEGPDAAAFADALRAARIARPPLRRAQCAG
jgi:hypothetical protein